MKLIKKILNVIAFSMAVGTAFTITSLKVSAARLDKHDGIIVSYGTNIKAYKNSGCTTSAEHYLCPGDWYEWQYGNPSFCNIKYPITVKLNYGGEKKPTFFTYFFKYSDYHKYSDSSTGSFSVPFNNSSWYNSLTGNITYTDKTDNGGTGNGSKCYVSNNYGFVVTTANPDGNKMLKCSYKSSKVMYADYVQEKIYYNPTDRKDADWHWSRASKSWSTENLHQGKNTVYYAGTDASANYATGSSIFYYDTKNPICYYSYNKSNGKLTLWADDDKSPGNGNYSGLRRFEYRVKKNGGDWSSWSPDYKNPYTFEIKDSGKYEILLHANDNAGNNAYLTINVIKRSPPIATTINNTYHNDIDVISSIKIKNKDTLDILPKDGYTVKFDIPNVTSETKALIIPANSTQTIWFKWHTPKTPQTLHGSYTIHTDNGDVKSTATFDVTELSENTPPNPQGTDKMPQGFAIPTSGGTESSSRSWTEWTFENNVFKENTYSARLSSLLSVTADSHNPTEFMNNGILNIKSGYGIQERVNTCVITNSISAVTPCQNVIGMYPEFEYNSYYRVFDKLSAGMFQLKPNKYSMYKSRTHFTPVWWQNGVDYILETYNIDSWTPAGMLTSYSTKKVRINGSVYDDWHVFPKN